MKEFKREIDEVVILFNRQAERHINYLESLLDNPIFNNFKKETHSKSNDEIPLADLTNQTAYSAPQINSSHPVQKPDMANPIPLPTKTVKAFYAHFGGNNLETNNQTKDRKPNNKNQEFNTVQTRATPQTKQERLLRETVQLFNQGLNSIQIAKKLAISTAEVKLILQLKKQL